MDFLSERGIYHGDLAARNLLLTDMLDAKISDFGLSQRLYVNLQERQKLELTKALPLPIKWLALEVLTKQQIVPIKSDVWSFGVTIWEIFSVGKQPYRTGRDIQKLKVVWIPFYRISQCKFIQWSISFSGIDINELIYDLSYGIRLPNPISCPICIKKLLERCFYEAPGDRPDFKEIKLHITTSFNAIYVEYQSQNKRDKDQNVSGIGICDNTNNEMKTRYTKVLQENMKRNEKNYAVKTACESPKQKENSSSIAYATMEDYKKLESSSSINQHDMMYEV